MTKKKNIWLTILTIVLIFVGIIALVVVGGYFLIKSKFGIDLLDIKSKISLLNRDFEESEIFSTQYDDEDNYNAFKKLFGDGNQVYMLVDGKYSFKKTELSNSTMQNDTILTDSELTSLLNLIIKNADEDDFEKDEIDFLKYIELREIRFSNLQSSSETTTVQTNCVYEFKLASANDSDGLSNFILNSFVPKSIFITTIFNLDFSNTNCFDYSITNLRLTINALTEDESDSILNLLNSLIKIDSKEDLQNSFNSLTTSLIFGNDSYTGFVGSIVGNDGFSFVENSEETNFYNLIIKKL